MTETIKDFFGKTIKKGDTAIFTNRERFGAGPYLKVGIVEDIWRDDEGAAVLVNNTKTTEKPCVTRNYNVIVSNDDPKITFKILDSG